VIAMPLDPHRLFVASHRREGLTYPSAKELTRSVNKMTAKEAYERVFGLDGSHAALVQKYLGKGTQHGDGGEDK
jgi:hypothetical protein